MDGRTTNICTTIRAFPTPKVTWYIYGRKLEMGDRHSSTLTDKGELALEIKNFGWKDVAEYRVEVTNEYGTASQSIKVDMAGMWL